MKNLLNKFFFNLSYFLFWVGYFVFARLFFLIYYFDKTQELNFITILKTFIYGLRLDMAFAGYLSIVPFLLIIFTFFINFKSIGNIIKLYTFPIIVFVNLMLLVDAGIYEAWGVRVDTSLLPYLNTPELMISSVSTLHLLIGIIFWLLISYIFIKIFNKVHAKFFKKIDFIKWQEIPLLLIITASLIIPIRGGFQTIPVNQSNVYFSDKMFANHASINFIWNFFNTLTHKTDGTNPYKYFDEKIANDIVFKNQKNLLNSNIDSILNTKNPNVILILWESLSAKVVGSVGGEPNVTPNLNKYSKEGILFTNFYANGDRTDKGIPAILSGYYPLPFKRIMRMPNKTRSLPMLPKKMNELGYKTSFYYGGDLNFGNMNTYLRNADISDIVDGSEFDTKDWSSKWGVYDDVFINRFIKDLSFKQQEPFFKIALTLSSHEPYQINDEYKFGKDSNDNNYRSANYYTDKQIGKFLDFAKTQEWYKNTLIVIMSDHGNWLPLHSGEYNSPKKFKIPMLWLGGALNKTNIEVNTFSSQVDFAYTLLDLLNVDNKEFVFGKNIFNSSKNMFAHYTFNKGFGIINKNNIYVYDYTLKKPLVKEGKNTKLLDSLGKSITQNIYDDFLNRK